MALKPTIYKLKIHLSDMDRQVYETLDLTVAQHPSETLERMMARVLAYCFNACEGLVFTKGLSTPDEPDVWCRSLDDRLLLWLDVGEPTPERLKKASRLAETVRVYSFNSKSAVWWAQASKAVSTLPVSVWQFPADAVAALAGCIERTLEFSLSISDSTAFASTPRGEIEIPCRLLSANP